MKQAIKRYFWAVAMAIVALLLAIIGKQQRTIDRQKLNEAKRDIAEHRAAQHELERQAKAKAKAAEDAQAKRVQVERDMAQGKRDYFEQD